MRAVLALAERRADLDFGRETEARLTDMRTHVKEATSFARLLLSGGGVIELCEKGARFMSMGGCFATYHVLCVRDGELAVELAALEVGDVLHECATKHGAALKAHIREPLEAAGVDTAALDDLMLVAVLLRALDAEPRLRFPRPAEGGPVKPFPQGYCHEDAKDGLMATVAASAEAAFIGGPSLPWSTDPAAPLRWPCKG